MSSETEMRQTVVEALRSLDAVSVENSCGVGTPDVNYVEGWIELKSKERWPPRGGVLKIDHFTSEQKVWLIRRRRAHGNVFLLLKVGQEWLLFEGDVGAAFAGRSKRDELLQVATAVWPNGLNRKHLLMFLEERNDRRRPYQR